METNGKSIQTNYDDRYEIRDDDKRDRPNGSGASRGEGLKDLWSLKAAAPPRIGRIEMQKKKINN